MKVANITLKFKKFILKNLWNFKEPHKELFTIYNEYKKYRNMFSEKEQAKFFFSESNRNYIKNTWNEV